MRFHQAKTGREKREKRKKALRAKKRDKGRKRDSTLKNTKKKGGLSSSTRGTTPSARHKK